MAMEKPKKTGAFSDGLCPICGGDLIRIGGGEQCASSRPSHYYRKIKKPKHHNKQDYGLTWE